MKTITNINSDNNDVSIYIMEEHGNAFCELTYYENERHNMFLSNLNVSEHERRKGMATELLSIVEDIVKPKGCKYLYLHVNDSTSWIADWYKRIGFITYKSNDDKSCEMFKILI